MLFLVLAVDATASTQNRIVNCCMYNFTTFIFSSSHSVSSHAGNGNDTVIVKSVVVKPDHLQISKTWNVTTDCYNSKCICNWLYHSLILISQAQTVTRNGAILHMKLSWIDPSGMPIVLTDVDLNLCDFLTDYHNPCPWKPGNHSISYNNQFWSNLFPTVRHDCGVVCIDFIIFHRVNMKQNWWPQITMERMKCFALYLYSH